MANKRPAWEGIGAKEYLHGLRGIALEVRRLEAALDDLRKDEPGVPSTSRFDAGRLPFHADAGGESDARHAKQARVTNADPTAAQAMKTPDREIAVADAKARADAQRREAEEYIACLWPLERDIVRLRCFEAKAWYEVAEILDYAIGTLNNKYAALIGKLDTEHGNN
jgi:hypothetical protein